MTLGILLILLQLYPAGLDAVVVVKDTASTNSGLGAPLGGGRLLTATHITSIDAKGIMACAAPPDVVCSQGLPIKMLGAPLDVGLFKLVAPIFPTFHVRKAPLKVQEEVWWKVKWRVCNNLFPM